LGEIESDMTGKSGNILTYPFPERCCWIVCLLLLISVAAARAREQPHVVAYCAQDQTYAEPIFRQFEQQTGIKVRAVYDNEAVKTVGLANRLVAERNHPVCDVFWGNEEMRTRQLAAQGVFRETNGWAGFGYRSRRIVVNTNRLAMVSSGLSFQELTNAQWRGKVALAYPQFGTTATHFHVLRQVWGENRWRAWCHALADNKPLLVDGNSEVVKAVARSDAWVGVTDSDDIADGQREGLPVAALPISEQTLLIPNTVAVIRGGPDPSEAQRLFSYLQTPAVVDALIQAKAIEGARIETVTPRTLTPQWSRILEDVGPTTAELNQLFLR
jgi:iron(III) transport system substrate-binding protein